MVSAVLNIIAELLSFFLPIAKKRIDEKDQRAEQDELLDFQAAATAGNDDDINAMFHDWETRAANRRRTDGAGNGSVNDGRMPSGQEARRRV